MSDVQLQLSPDQETQDGLPYQHLRITLATEDGVITPQDLKGLELPAGIKGNQGIVLEGKGPIWLYSYLVHECHASSWVGCYDPRLGIVVVVTHNPVVKVGSVFPVDLSK